jgi:hypothetical protein
MDIVLTILEQWGLYLLAGVIIVYFAWHGLAFLQAKPVSFRNDPILTTTTFGWGSIWLVGNGIGNALFIFGVVAITGEIVSYHTGQVTLPTIPGSEALVFLLGLMPSLYQFRYQADPGYIETLTAARRMVAMGMTIADGLCCALGWYWWLLPPTFVNGAFDFPYDQLLIGGVFIWSLFSSYLAQYMAHMQLYDLLGLEPPTFPNPFAALWQIVVTHFTGTDAKDPHVQQASASARPVRSNPAHARRNATTLHSPFEANDDPSLGLTSQEWEPQP